MAFSRSCREGKRRRGLGWRPREALSATRRGGPIWPRPPSRSSFRVRATFPSTSIKQPWRRMPSISTAARGQSGSTTAGRGRRDLSVLARRPAPSLRARRARRPRFSSASACRGRVTAIFCCDWQIRLAKLGSRGGAR